MWKVYAIFLLEGIASIGFQVVTIRQFTPHFGSAIEVTSIVIAFFLASLSLGYALGGKIKDTAYIPMYMSINFVVAAIIFGLMFSSGVMEYIFSFFTLNGTIGDLIFLSLYCLLFLTVPVTLLGTTLPFLSSYLNTSNHSEATGKSLTYSTVGSFLGALLTSLVFFLFLGVSLTIVTLCALLMTAMLVIQHRSIKAYVFSLFVVLVLFWVNTSHLVNPNLVETPYASYRVETLASPFAEPKIFKINNQNASFHISSVASSPYISRVLELTTKTFGYTQHDILVLGAGGFSLSHYDRTDNQYTYVDLDPDIADIATKHFLEAPIKGQLIAQDARKFLQHNKKKFDVIVIDLFSHHTTMPWHVSTQAFFELARNSTKEDGLIVMNIVGDIRFSSTFDKRIHDTILNVIPYCYVDLHILRNSKEPQNKIYVCLPQAQLGDELNDDNAFNFMAR